jgi:hypothetical protein
MKLSWQSFECGGYQKPAHRGILDGLKPYCLGLEKLERETLFKSTKPAQTL